MNRKPIEKYEQSLKCLDDALEEKRSEMIAQLFQKRNIVASEVAIAKKEYESKLAQLNKLNREIQCLQDQVLPKSRNEMGQEYIGRHYDSKYDGDSLREPEKSNIFTRILSANRKRYW